MQFFVFDLSDHWVLKLFIFFQKIESHAWIQYTYPDNFHYCIPMLVTLNLINHDIFAVIFHSHGIPLVIFHVRGISQRIFNGWDHCVVFERDSIAVFCYHIKWSQVSSKIHFCDWIYPFLHYYLRVYNKTNIQYPFLLNIEFIHSRCGNIHLGCASVNITHLEWINREIQRKAIEYLLIIRRRNKRM